MTSSSISELFRVDGLVALITGGGTGEARTANITSQAPTWALIRLGIGLMMTKALALNGASKVYISGRRREVLDQAAKQSPHGNIIPLVADICSKEDIEALADHIRKDVGHLNLLVANAGMWGPGPGQPLGTSLQEVQAEAMKTTMDEWDQCFRTHVHGCYYSIMAVLDLLDEGNKRKNYGNGEVKSQVIVTGSIGGYSRIVGGRNAYRASKAAVTHLAKCLATGFQEFGIRVNTLAPGLFPSELAAPLIEKYNGFADEDGKIDRKRLPEERSGTEEDITGTMLYLVSRAGAYNNGNVCVVDGGMVSVMPASY
ncbi:MAG: hypothetical protein Q9198_003243 [Flavoplaca austrocitrina]